MAATHNSLRQQKDLLTADSDGEQARSSAELPRLCWAHVSKACRERSVTHSKRVLHVTLPTSG